MQAEGGFVYAFGTLLQEDVTYNAKQPEFDTTLNYKIPSAACSRREMFIHMLKVCAPLLSLLLCWMTCHETSHDMIKPNQQGTAVPCCPSAVGVHGSGPRGHTATALGSQQTCSLVASVLAF